MSVCSGAQEKFVALPILSIEHPLSLPIWVGSNAAIALSYLFDLNPLNACTAGTHAVPTARRLAVHTCCGQRLLPACVHRIRERCPAAAASVGRSLERRAASLPLAPEPIHPALEQAASWALLACVMKGFAVSVVSPPAAPPPSLTAEQLAAYLAPKLNAARELRAKIFGCSDPRLALCARQVETTGTMRSNSPAARWPTAEPLARGGPSDLAGPILAPLQPPPPASLVRVVTPVAGALRSRSMRRRSSRRVSARPRWFGPPPTWRLRCPRLSRRARFPRSAQCPALQPGSGRTLFCLSPRPEPRLVAHSVPRSLTGGPRRRG